VIRVADCVAALTIRHAILLGFCILFGCRGVREPSPRAVAAVPADPITVVRNGGDPVSSLRATFVASVRRGDSLERARGVLLVSKPDRFRLRLSSLFGFTILDYLSNAGHDRLWLASADRVLVGDEISRSASFSPEAVRWIFLRQREGLDGGCFAKGSGDEALVECTDDRGAVHYRGYVQRASGLLQREVVLGDDKPRLSVAYSDFRSSSGVRLPYSIDWTEASSGARVEIEVDRYEVDPSFTPNSFTPTAH
jgi:hypothetical protein